MNPKQAVTLIIQATDQLRLTRTDHIKLQQAIAIVEQIVNNQQAQDALKKEEKPKEPLDNAAKAEA